MLGTLGHFLLELVEASGGRLLPLLLAFALGLLITLLPGAIVAGLLIYVAVRVGPALLGMIAARPWFRTLVNTLGVFVPTVIALMTGVGVLASVGVAIGAIIAVVGMQEELRKLEARFGDEQQQRGSDASA